MTVTYLQAAGYTGSQERMARAALLTKSGAANKARVGILPFNNAELLPGPSSPTPDMHTVTTPGCIVMQDAAGGSYVGVVDGTVTLTHTASNATNPRTDLVIFRVYDNEAGDAAATTPLVLPGSAGSVNVQTVTGAVELVTGVAGPGAPVPALPSTRCVVLAQVTIPANATTIVAGNIATTAAIGRPPKTVAAGGVLPVLTEAEIAGLAQYDGQLFYAIDSDRLLRSKGGTVSVLADPAVFTAWGSYVPTWTGATSGVGGVGTGGSISGWFKRMGLARCDWKVVLVTGADATFPTGNYLISLPVQAQLRGATTIVGGSLFPGGANLHGDCVADAASSGNKFQIAYHGSAGNAATGNPASWASRTVSFWGSYEPAV